MNASLVDLGHRFRLLVNVVDGVKVEQPMPKSPVARVWKPRPSLRESAEAWILAGGAHHTVLSYAMTAEHLSDWAEMVGIEAVIIDKDTTIPRFKNELRWSEAAYRLR